ncbi:hypothetical protein BLL40_15105 [Domibacillus mangrovi]|uniref:Uncharacterized protein n=2 Tax=Domibacillus mangrovi TaxID=1714354 RepID=A0A1Q5NZP2_9BACI|nr:hypothetical protein BLL40_15105 [Domibacillus mangrovi]
MTVGFIEIDERGDELIEMKRTNFLFLRQKERQRSEQGEIVKKLFEDIMAEKLLGGLIFT